MVVVIAGITAFAVSSGNERAEGRPCPSRLSADVDQLDIGDTVPNFALAGLDGGCVRLDQFRGQPLVVNFWASYCHPCRVEFPLLQDARERYANRDLEVIGIDHKDIASDARAFAEEKGADWPLLVDDENEVSTMFGVANIPQTFFVARDGTIVEHVYGLTSARDLEAGIKAAIRH